MRDALLGVAARRPAGRIRLLPLIVASCCLLAASTYIFTSLKHPTHLLTSKASFQGDSAPHQHADAREYRLLHLSRHQGTTADINHILAVELGYTVVQVNPLFQFGVHADKITREDAERAFRDRNGWALCAAYDAVVFTDTAMDAWPFLHAALNGRCRTSLIVDVTNRFDWFFMNTGGQAKVWPVLDDRDFDHYLFDFNASLALDHVFLVQNNAFEAVYLASRGIDVPPTIQTIRPWGYISKYKFDGKAEDDRGRVAVIGKTSGDLWLAQRCGELGIAYKRLTGHYGGADRLANFKAILHMPYQVSVMSMWENLAAGVVTIIPSLGMLEEVFQTTTHLQYGGFIRELKSEFHMSHTRMAQVVDWYLPELEHLWVQFRSWDDLKLLVSGAKDAMLVEHSKHVRRYMHSVHQPQVAKDWQHLIMRAAAHRPRGPKGMMAG